MRKQILEKEMPLLSNGVKALDNSEKKVLTTCGCHCGGKCPINLHLRQGRIERITPHIDDVPPVITACLKGLNNHFHVYAPTRLKYPLKQTGERGSGKFKRISWDEALDTVANKMKNVIAKDGSEAILEATYSGTDSAFIHRTIPGGSNPLSRLLDALGGRTSFANSTSEQGGWFASVCTYGFHSACDANDPADLMNTKLIILWGKNPIEATRNSAFPYHLMQAKKAGIRIIYIDPCYTETARVYADEWIPIYPSTDTAMAVAMAYVMITENLHDKAYLDRYTYGFEEYRKYVMGETDNTPKTPEWAEKITGVPADKIRALAREYATTKPAALFIDFSPGRTAYGEQYHRACVTLQAMTGNIGIRGGCGGCDDLYRGAWASQMSFIEDSAGEGMGKRWGGKGVEIKNGFWADAVMQGKAGGFPSDIKIVYIIGHNLINQRQNTLKGIEALKKAEFVVCHEKFMTPTAEYADIVLPVGSSFEWTEEDLFRNNNTIFFAPEEVISPLYGSRTDYDIITELAKRLGIPEEQFNPEDPDTLLGEQFAQYKLPMTWEEFKKIGYYKKQRPEPFVAHKQHIDDIEHYPFPTPSGKIEIYSQKLAKTNFGMNWRPQGDNNGGYIPPIPMYIECEETKPNSQYPLRLVNAHHRLRTHSTFWNIPQLRNRYKHEIWIHPDDAGKRNINDGDIVEVYSRVGKIRIPAKVTDKVMRGVIRLYQGAWLDIGEDGVDNGGCPNMLIDDQFTSPGGAANYNTCLVEVVKRK